MVLSMLKFPQNVGRLEAFSDAVFAFAATLMVVNLDINAPLGFDSGSLVRFISFAVSFFVLFLLWTVHYNYFRRTRYVDLLVMVYNAILLFVVLYFVFPLKTLIMSMFGNGVKNFGQIAPLFMLYGIVFLTIFLCYSLMYLQAFKKDRQNGIRLELYFYFQHFMVFVLVAIISIIMAAIGLGIWFGMPGFIYALIGPICMIHGRWFKKKYGTI